MCIRDSPGALLDSLAGHGGVILEGLTHVAEYLLDAADVLLVCGVCVLSLIHICESET